MVRLIFLSLLHALCLASASGRSTFNYAVAQTYPSNPLTYSVKGDEGYVAEVTQQEEPRNDGGPVSSHILDTTTGRPAAGIKIQMYKRIPNNQEYRRELLSEKVTNSDGRAAGFTNVAEFEAGVYKMNFDIEDYFAAKNVEQFYPYVEIVFNNREPSEHYHIPLLLTANGYTTYRGS